MRKLWLLLTTALLCGGAIARAEIVEVPLPELEGAYAEGGTIVRTASFQISGQPVVIRGTWLRLSGEAAGGTTECEGGGTSPWPFDFTASMDDATTGGLWVAGGPTSGEAGPFAMTDDFWPISGASWGFLVDGSGEVELVGAPAPLVGLCWPASPPPDARVEEAVLIIDADFAVPVETTTWGGIKALYER